MNYEGSRHDGVRFRTEILKTVSELGMSFNILPIRALRSPGIKFIRIKSAYIKHDLILSTKIGKKTNLLLDKIHTSINNGKNIDRSQ